MSCLSHYLIFALISLIQSVVVRRFWEKRTSEEDSLKKTIEAIQASLAKLKSKYQGELSDLLKANHELKIFLDFTKSENEKLKNIPKSTIEILSEEILNEAILYEIKSQGLEEKLIRDRQTFELKFNRLSQKIKQRTTEKNNHKLENQALLEKLRHLEQEFHNNKKVEVSSLENKRLTRRPNDMWDVKFARMASIELNPFPENLKQKAQEHYNDTSFVSLNATVDFLRHKFSNYEFLCRELRNFDEEARHILKCRVNAEIWKNLYK
ncbi:hypothetical protein [Altericista sp. CCNU0014]|uniref:hypothetical protein n=1 Tax=Altericista sp. CCNU0014 TaxID=3082949 RepID=UPI0038517192